MKKVSFKNQFGEKLVGILHTPKNKTNKGIVFCHGFKGNKDRELITKLSKKLEAYYILRFDFSGNGESEGKFEDQSYSKYIEELKVGIDYVKNLGIKELIVMGHSLGANIVVLEQKKYNNINKIILLAPAFYRKFNKLSNIIIVDYIKTLFKKYQEKEVFDMATNKHKTIRLKRKFFAEILFNNPKKYIGNINIPILIILAEKDKAVNTKKTAKFLRKRKLTFYTVKEAAHNFREERYLKEVSDYITKWLK